MGPSEYALPPATPAAAPSSAVDGSTNPRQHGYVTNVDVSSMATHTVLASLLRNALLQGVGALDEPERPATRPGVQKVVIRHESLLWPLHISPSGDFSFVTVRDVVDSIRVFTAGAANGDDFNRAADPEKVSRAFYSRTRNDPTAHAAGVTRGDFLPGSIVGLELVARESLAAEFRFILDSDA